ncbi:hypothetical protein APS67_003791 [Streptomyces sp. AVP053U2]|nr:hypothetical protein APS67_003791 [Streptomyces sp. AVP053U2]
MAAHRPTGCGAPRACGCYAADSRETQKDLVSLKAGDKCADVWWGKEANGTPVRLWPCTGTAHQTWRRS